MARPPLVLASANPGKLREFAALLGERYELVCQAELGVSPVVEVGATLQENALLKARHAAAVTGLAALADDSGLEVDALGGRPGVHSARYAGPAATDADNIRRLLADLEGVAPDRRSARFRCVLVLVDGPGDPAPLMAEGVWEGHIALAPAGSGGFGYDPLFVESASGRTAADLPAAVKNARSHRALALAALLEQLRSKGPGAGGSAFMHKGPRGL